MESRLFDILRKHQDFIDAEIFRTGVCFSMDYNNERITVLISLGQALDHKYKNPYEVVLKPISTNMNNGDSITLLNTEIKNYNPSAFIF